MTASHQQAHHHIETRKAQKVGINYILQEKENIGHLKLLEKIWN